MRTKIEIDDSCTDEEIERMYNIATLGILIWIIAETVRLFA